jgi:hypothetical protein
MGLARPRPCSSRHGASQVGTGLFYGILVPLTAAMRMGAEAAVRAARAAAARRAPPSPVAAPPPPPPGSASASASASGSVTVSPRSRSAVGAAGLGGSAVQRVRGDAGGEAALAATLAALADVERGAEGVAQGSGPHAAPRGLNAQGPRAGVLLAA